MKFILKILICIILFFLVSCNIIIQKDSNSKQENSPHASIILEDLNFGAVKGVLVTEEPSEKIGIILYLGQVITDSNGMYGGFLNPAEAPLAIYDDKTGEFAFTNVEPGEYSLIIHEVVLGGQAYMDETGNIVIITVESGKITDLENIQFEGF